jgi:MSHA biogenesis protein MshI
LRSWGLLSSEKNSDWALLAELAEDKERALKRYQCTTLLPNGGYQLIQVDAPEVPEAEQKEALRWRLKDMIEHPVEAVSFDILPLPEKVLPGGARQLYAAVARNDVIEPVVKGFHGAGMHLEVIDVPELAQRNVAALFEDENRALAFLAFDETSALLTFTYQGELFSLRRIEVGARQFLDASEDRRAQLAERIVLELQRSIDGVDRQFSAISLSRMIVALPPDCGLEEQLASNLYIPFEAMDLAKVMDLSAVPELQSPEAQRLALKSIGAALRHEEVAA